MAALTPFIIAVLVGALVICGFLSVVSSVLAMTNSTTPPEPVAQPVKQPVSEPAAQPVTQPAPEPVTQPVTQPAPEPVAQPAPVVTPVPPTPTETSTGCNGNEACTKYMPLYTGLDIAGYETSSHNADLITCQNLCTENKCNWLSWDAPTNSCLLKTAPVGSNMVAFDTTRSDSCGYVIEGTDVITSQLLGTSTASSLGDCRDVCYAYGQEQGGCDLASWDPTSKVCSMYMGDGYNPMQSKNVSTYTSYFPVGEICSSDWGTAAPPVPSACGNNASCPSYTTLASTGDVGGYNSMTVNGASLQACQDLCTQESCTWLSWNNSNNCILKTAPTGSSAGTNIFNTVGDTCTYITPGTHVTGDQTHSRSKNDLNDCLSYCNDNPNDCDFAWWDPSNNMCYTYNTKVDEDDENRYVSYFPVGAVCSPTWGQAS